jgi:DNA-binding CsgD family transcriptional regulator/predicted ester cyclase
MCTRAEEIAAEFLLPLWNEKSIEIIDDFVAPTADIKTTFFSGQGPGILRQNVQYTLNAFSSFELKMDEIIPHHDKCIFKWSGTAIHTGPVFNIQPTGKKIVFSEIVSGEIQGNSIVSYHSFSDIPRILAHTDPMPLNINYAINTIKVMTGKRLTTREVECLHLWFKGFSIKDTARTLGGLSHRTVQSFRENIKRKLNVETYQQLYSLIQKSGIMPIFLNC